VTHSVPEPAKLEYQVLTVEQILNKFQAELEKDAVEYLKEAKRVAQYDATLRDSQRALSALSTKTSQLLQQQSELEGMLKGIGAFHSEFEKNLDQLEVQVDQLFGAQSHVVPTDSDVQRENAYSTAVQCEQRLQALQEAATTMLQRLELGGGQGPVADIVKILQQHEMQLASLEQTNRAMEHDINQLSLTLNQ
jgi:chromosome segregation ATPase